MPDYGTMNAASYSTGGVKGLTSCDTEAPVSPLDSHLHQHIKTLTNMAILVEVMGRQLEAKNNQLLYKYPTEAKECVERGEPLPLLEELKMRILALDRELAVLNQHLFITLSI